MNMTSVLHRRSRTGVIEHTFPTTPGSGPPSPTPPDPGDGLPVPWPMRAKVLVALLVVATVLGAVGSAIAFTSSDDGAAERLLQDQVTTLTGERDSALDAVAELDAELMTLRQQLVDAQAGNDDLSGRIDELGAQIATLTDERDAALNTVGDLEGQIAELGLAVNALETDLAAERQRVTAAIAERDALAEQFPIKFDASLRDVATGDYDVSASQLYCSGLGSCGKASTFGHLTIRKTAEGNLRAGLAGFAEGGLFGADGALHMAAGSTTAVPACAGTSRPALVTMTIFPGRYQVANGGASAVVGLNAVITVEAPATGNCPAVLAFYSANFTPHA